MQRIVWLSDFPYNKKKIGRLIKILYWRNSNGCRIILFASQIWTDRLLCVLCSFYQQPTHPYRRKDFYVFSNTLLDKYLIIRHFDNSKTPFNFCRKAWSKQFYREVLFNSMDVLCQSVSCHEGRCSCDHNIQVQKPASFMYSNFMYFQAYLYFPNNIQTN